MMLQDVWIVIRSKNDAELIGKTLEGIASQEYPGRVRRLHIDSGSNDGTCEIIRDSKPDQFLQIRAEDYIPGRVLNTGLKLTDGDWVVFLNSDAEPVGRDWLAKLVGEAVAPSDERGIKGKAGAVFSRQVPRPDCEAVYAHDYERCFGSNRESARWPHFFSMVSSAVNREAWSAQCFREDLRYSEDEEWSFRIKNGGWQIRYAEKSAVMHSHNYTLAQARKRNYGEGFALGATPALAHGQVETLPGAVLAAGRDAIKDLVYCVRRRRLVEWPRAVAVRLAQRLGKRDGIRDGRRHFIGGHA